MRRSSTSAINRIHKHVPLDRRKPCSGCAKPKPRAAEEQVRARCQAPQPRFTGSRERVESDESESHATSRCDCSQRKGYPSPIGLGHLMSRRLGPPWCGVTAWAQTSPTTRSRAQRPVAREGRFPRDSAKRTHGGTHPRCLRSPGLPEGMSRPAHSIAGVTRVRAKRLFNLRPTPIAWTTRLGGWGLDRCESKLSRTPIGSASRA